MNDNSPLRTVKSKILAISVALSLVGLSSSAMGSRPEEDRGSYGLTFRSYEVIQDERTSLNLTPDHPVNAAKGFSLEFDVKIRNGFSFGYIFRFIDDRLNHLDLCSNHDASKFSFIFGNSDRIISSTNIEMVDGGSALHHFRIAISPGDDRFVCTIDSLSVDVHVGDSSPGKFRLLFGRIDNERYYTADIPGFTLSDVVLKDANDRRKAAWTMSRHSETEVFDNLNDRRAVVRNAAWDIDRHSRWLRRKVFNFPTSEIGLAYSPDKSEIYVISDSTMTVYHIREDVADVRRSISGTMPVGVGAQLIYDSPDKMLLAATPALPGIRIYDLTENRWSGLGEGRIPPISNHAGTIFDDSTRTAYLVGGYGMHSYFNELHSFSLDGDRLWKSRKIGMTPRYLCAAGMYGGRLLVAGGYGSRSGLQKEDPRNLYDILSIDTVTGQCDTLADMSCPDDISRFVFSSSIVPDEKNGCFYSLIFDNEKYNSEILLAKVNAATGAVECFADPLPFKFYDLLSHCHLFRAEGTPDSIYAVITQPQGDYGYEISIYSMDYPPLHSSDILVTRKSFPWKALFAVLAGLIAIISLLLISRKKDNGRLEDLTLDENTMKVSKSFIRLLGGFQVIDSKGVDITGEFPPILKGLLSFIILRYAKEKKGISNNLLENAFWSHLEHQKALNNRRVNISKLRSLLMRVGDVRIDCSDGYVNFIIGNDVRCDYLSLMKAMASSSVGDVVATGSMGKLLPDLFYDCLSEFRSDLTFRLSEFLRTAPEGSDRRSRITRLHLANIVLLQDELDENAIAVKCRMLYALGEKGLSKSVYDTYASQYRDIIGSEPELSYSGILKNSFPLNL